MKAKIIKKSADPKATITFRHNFLPPLLGLVMALSIYGLLNAQWVAAQYEYRYVKAPAEQQVAIFTPDPNAVPELSIPSINIKAPIIFEVTSYDNNPVQKALQNGVLHFGQTANPGQAGNVVIVGHSSGAPWTPGNYKYIFTLLDKVKVTDKIILDYKGTRYIYEITSTEIIKPTDLNVLNQPSDKYNLSLVTCAPVGTSKSRLVVHAKQNSPKPLIASNTTATTQTTPSAQVKLPSSATSPVWDRIKQLF